MTKPKPGSTRGNPLARFDSFTNRQSGHPATYGSTPCWLWTGGQAHNGYAQFRTCVGGIHETFAVHRFSYERHVAAIPPGMTVDHLCKVRHCVNPEHLEVVDLATNVLRGDGPFSLNARKTHCLRGHEFTSPNTRTDKRGNRNCRACDSERSRRTRQRKLQNP